MKKAFSVLNTDHLRMKHFTKSEFYVKPEAVSIGTTQKSKIVENKSIMTVKEQFAYMIPLKKTLKLFLEVPTVYNTIKNYQDQLLSSKTGTIENIIQGSLWQNIIHKYDKNQVLFPLIIFF